MNIQKKKQRVKWWKDNRKIMQDHHRSYDEPAQRLQDLMRDFSAVGEFKVYNSSMNIEKDCLTMKNEKDSKTLGLDSDNNKLLKLSVPFSEGLSQPWGCNDFKQYFWFQIQKRLKAKGFSSTRQKQIKPLFQDQVKNLKIPKYLRFLHIRQSFQNKTQMLNLKLTASDEQLRKQIKQIIMNLIKVSQNSCIQKLKKFMQQGDVQSQQNKRKFITTLYHLACQKINKKVLDQKMAFKIEFLDNLMNSKKRGSTNTFIKSQDHDHDLLPVEFLENEKVIDFLYTPKQFIKFTTAIDKEESDKKNKMEYPFLENKMKFPFLENKMKSPFLEQICIQYNSVRGCVIQAAFINVLDTPNTEIIFDPCTQPRVITLEEREFFLDVSKQASILQVNFSRLFKLAHKNKNKYFLGLPAIIKNQAQQILEEQSLEFSSSNPSFDFSIILYNSCYKQFEINTYDYTISRKIKIIAEKAVKAQRKIQQITSNSFNQKQYTKDSLALFPFLPINEGVYGSNTFKIVHTIICPQEIVDSLAEVRSQMKMIKNKEQIKKKKQIQKDINNLNQNEKKRYFQQNKHFQIKYPIEIQFCPIEKMKIIRCFNKSAVKQYQAQIELHKKLMIQSVYLGK